MIESLLQNLGFTNKEVQVYLAVLQEGKISYTDIAILTKINRTTVYSTAKELLKKGLVYEDYENSTTFLLARPPKNIQLFVAREKEELKQKEILAKQAADELNSFTVGQRYSIPRMRFINEQELDSFFREQAPSWNESIMENDGVFWGFQEVGFVENFSDVIKWYWKQAPKDLVLQLLSNDVDVEKEFQTKKFPNRHVKCWNESEFTSTVWVCGEYIIFLSATKRPFYAIEIRDRMIAENMRSIFKALWSDTIT